MRYFFIDPAELCKDAPLVRGCEAQHLLQVLRLGTGDKIGLLDGTGRGFEAQVAGRSGNDVRVTIISELEVCRESPLEIVVAQALLKEKKMDLLIRQLTELGIAQWRPVVSRRSIPRLTGDRLAARIARWQKIAVAAMKLVGILDSAKVVFQTQAEACYIMILKYRDIHSGGALSGDNLTEPRTHRPSYNQILPVPNSRFGSVAFNSRPIHIQRISRRRQFPVLPIPDYDLLRRNAREHQTICNGIGKLWIR